jgi:thymidylate synthase (FAD)
MNVLDNGIVELEDFMGGDLKVVNTARASYGNKHEKMEKGDDKLIEYLMRNRHGSVYEHSVFTFFVKCPISVAREWFRHRMASYSEISGRYVQLDNEFYVPEEKNMREQKGKPGNYTFHSMEKSRAEACIQVIEESYDEAYDSYNYLLEQGVAREVARNVLPVGIYTQFYWTINSRSLMNFLNLRNEEHAMLEIREYAKAIEIIFSEKMPVTYHSFIMNKRVAP